MTTITDAVHGAERWQYPRSKLTPLEVLGKGQFGEVRKMVAAGIGDDRGPTIVAVKSAHNSAENKQHDGTDKVDSLATAAECEFMDEMLIMKKMR